MEMTKKKKVMIMVIGILLASILAILSKILLPSDTNVEDFDSLFVKLIGFPVVASFYFLLIYTHNGVVPIYFGGKSRMSAAQIGLRFGACFGIIYLLGMQEVVVEASPYAVWGMDFVVYEFFMGFGEAVAAILLCFILAKLLLRKEEIEASKKMPLKKKFLAVAMIAIAFVVERAIVYETGSISSNVTTFPIPTYGWTCVFGVAMGLCFVMLYPVFEGQKNRSVKIMFITIGLCWMLFNSFIGFIYAGELFHLLLRSGMDVAVMFLAAWGWEKIS